MSIFNGFKLDTQAARQAEGGQYISRTGKYLGTFIKAEAVTSASGTEGISFDFKSDQGELASFALYVQRKDGSNTFGFNQLNALMTCLQIRELGAPVDEVASCWDNNEKKRVDMPVQQFVELLNKPVGLLIQMEEYRANNGSYKWRPGFAHAFCAKTERMAGEILDKKQQAERLPLEVAKLADKPLKNKAGATDNYSSYQQSNAPADKPFDDDPVPF